MEFSVNSHEAERRKMQDTFLAAEHGWSAFCCINTDDLHYLFNFTNTISVH